MGDVFGLAIRFETFQRRRCAEMMETLKIGRDPRGAWDSLPLGDRLAGRGHIISADRSDTPWP